MSSEGREATALRLAESVLCRKQCLRLLLCAFPARTVSRREVFPECALCF